jgi:hypothetical protein
MMNDYVLPGCPPFDQLPARLEVKAVAVLLAFSASDIPVLIAAGLLKPLGKPAPNAPKFFARVQIERLGQDLDWLNQATRCVSQHWKRKRDRRVNGAEKSVD